MVTINEANDDQPQETNNPPPSGEQVPQNSTISKLTQYFSTHRLESLLWLTRIMTIFFSFSFFLSPMGNASNLYYKALVANCATSALRLHQRVPRVSLSREFLAIVLLEDSAHYFLFSLIFMYNPPISLAVVPIALFAILHASSFLMKLLDAISLRSGLLRMAVGFVELQAVFILRSIAFAEIFLLPTCVLLIFSGRFSILSVFLYYRFLMLRYSSRRNPYTRLAFTELRMQAEFLANHPRCPGVVAQMLRSLVATALRFAPNIPAN